MKEYKISIEATVKIQELGLTDKDIKHLKTLIKKGHSIQAIKIVREKTNKDLAQSKLFVDGLRGSKITGMWFDQLKHSGLKKEDWDKIKHPDDECY